MYFNSNEGLKPLALNDAVLLEALDWANGELTCCRLGHPDAAPCDREQLVGPMLGLFHEIYRDRHEGRARAAWAVLAPRVDTLYPRSFDWEFCGPEGDVVERAPLFGDLIDAARLVVDEEDLDDDGQRELARFAGFAPGTNAQRHILRPKARGLMAKALSTFATSPRTPTRVWSTRSSSPRPSTTRSLSRSSRLPMMTGGSGSTRALSNSEESV